MMELDILLCEACPGKVPSLLVYADDVVSFKFVRHCAVSWTGDHSGHSVAEFHEVLRADWVIESLAEGNIAEIYTVAGRGRGHRYYLSMKNY
jgi:hypothetical protein